MITCCYSGTTSAYVSWQASQLQDNATADRAHQIGITYHTRWAHAAQQGKKNVNQKNISAFAFVGKAWEEKWIWHGGGGKKTKMLPSGRAQKVIYCLQDLPIAI